MARIPYPDPATMAPEIRDRLTRLGSLNVTRMMAHSEPVMIGYSKMGTALLGRGALDPVLREVVILRIGQLCESTYEWHQHVSVAKVVGMEQSMIDCIEQQSFDQLPPKERLAVRCAEEIFREKEISSATFSDAQQTFSPAELVEIALVSGYYIMTAGFLRSFGIEIEDGPPLGDSMRVASN